MITFAQKRGADGIEAPVSRPEKPPRARQRQPLTCAPPAVLLAGAAATLLLVLLLRFGRSTAFQGSTASQKLENSGGQPPEGYRAVLPIGPHDLLLGQPTPPDSPPPPLVWVPQPQRDFPDWEQERQKYQDFLVQDTADLRPGDQMWGGFAGPWLDSRWLAFWQQQRAAGADMGDRVFVPIHWWDCFWGCKDPPFRKMRTYLSTLDRRWTYFTVAWVDKGLTGKDTGVTVPDDLDLLVFASAGTTLGARNIYLPLLRAEREPQGLAKDIFASFVGEINTHQIRAKVQEKWGSDPDFLFTTGDFSICERSNYTLAPRGHGSTSFRMFEAIQLGSVPIFFWAWDLLLPYSELLEWRHMAVVVPQHAIGELRDRLAAFDYDRAQRLIVQHRHMFTWDYELRYIQRRLHAEVLSPVEKAAFTDMPGREICCR